MSGSTNRTLTDAELALLSNIFRIIAREITNDDDKVKLAPGELGMDYTNGMIYVRNPHTGNLVSPNNIEGIDTILSKLDSAGHLSAEYMNGVAFYRDVADLPTAVPSVTPDTILSHMTITPAIFIGAIESSTAAWPSTKGVLSIYKFDAKTVEIHYFDLVNYAEYTGRYDSNVERFDGWSKTSDAGPYVVSDETDAYDLDLPIGIEDLSTFTMKVPNGMRAGATIALNGGTARPVVDSDGAPLAYNIGENNTIMLLYDEYYDAWVLRDAGESASLAGVDVMQRRVSALNQDVFDLAESTTTAITNLGTQTQQKLDTLKAELEDEISGAGAGLSDRVADLSDHVDSLETELKQDIVNVGNNVGQVASDLQDLSTNVDTRITTLASKLSDTVDTVDTKVDGVLNRVDAVESAIGDNSSGLTGRVVALETSYDASKVTSVNGSKLPISVLPAGALERLYVVSAISILEDRTNPGYPTDASNGDTIKDSTSGLMYYITDENSLGTTAYMDGIEIYSAGAASSVDWTNIDHKPTTLSGYGITDAVHSSEKVTVASSANAGKLLVLNANGALDSDITGNSATTTSVEWTGVQHTPTTLAGYGITDSLVHADEKVTTASSANAGKILVLNASGDLDVNVTGNAATASAVEWAGVLNTPTTLGAYGITDAVNADEKVTVASSTNAGKILVLNSNGALDVNITGTAAVASSVNWTNVQSSPTTLTGYGITDAVNSSEKVASATAANAGKLLVLNSDGKLDVDVTGNAATASTMEWTGVQNTPTTLAGYGITDSLIAADEKVTEATSANVGKILVLNDAGKLDADITGDAATLESHNAAYFATASDVSGLTTLIGDTETRGTILYDVDQLKTGMRAIDASWITTGTISIDRLPHGALERCIVVTDDTARFALTADDAQIGDTVKVTSTGKMYFIIDDKHLDSEAGYTIYTASSATSVDWSGVTNKPTTLSGYGITDGATSTDLETLQTRVGLDDSSGLSARIAALETAVGNITDSLANDPGNIDLVLTNYTATGGETAVTAITNFNGAYDKLFVNYGQTILKVGIDYTVVDNGVTFDSSIVLAAGDVVQFIILKQKTS